MKYILKWRGHIIGVSNEKPTIKSLRDDYEILNCEIKNITCESRK